MHAVKHSHKTKLTILFSSVYASDSLVPPSVFWVLYENKVFCPREGIKSLYFPIFTFTRMNECVNRNHTLLAYIDPCCRRFSDVMGLNCTELHMDPTWNSHILTVDNDSTTKLRNQLAQRYIWRSLSLRIASLVICYANIFKNSIYSS